MKKITVVIKLSFLFLALLTFFSFTGYEEYKYPDKSEQLKIDTLQYVVLKYKGGRYPKFYSVLASDLSIVEIDTVLSSLKRAIQVYNLSVRSKIFVIRDLGEYKFQFVPVVNVKGEKTVWINAFCDAFEEDWKKNIILVMDEGNCYFTAKINLATKHVFELGTHGPG